jgi:hypothetical protein
MLKPIAFRSSYKRLGSRSQMRSASSWAAGREGFTAKV